MSGGCEEKDGKKPDPQESFLPFKTDLENTGESLSMERVFSTSVKNIVRTGLVTTITREEDGKEVRVKRYYHKVLEAKLVLAPGITVSLDTEFIENENEDVSKNDCELNAAKRLLDRLSRDYPRLPSVCRGMRFTRLSQSWKSAGAMAGSIS